MIDRVIDWSVRNRWVVLAVTLAIALLGAYAARQTPVDAIPDLSENQVIVYAPWPDHGPPEIQEQITSILSAQLQGIEGVLTIRASSEVGFSILNVIFGDDVGIAQARSRVEAKLSQVHGLPAGVEAEMAPEAPATGQIFWYVLVSPQLDLAQLRSLQDQIVGPRLSSVDGVAEVASVGGFQAEYQVQIDADALRKRQLSIEQVSDSLRRACQPGQAENKAHPARAQQVLRELRDTPISTSDGNAVMLSDLAHVSIGPQPRRGIFEMDGVETVGGVVMMRYGENPLEVTDRLERRLEEIEAELPHGVTILTVYDRVRLIHSALSTVSSTMLEAMLTASLCVVVVLLHFRTSLVISLTLPLTVLGSFLMLWCLRSLGWQEARTNIMSLAGLVISIGVLVDSSVVIAENVVHALRERFGDAPVRGDVRHLIAQACRGVGRPVFFSVLIMLLSFIPVLGLSGLEGKMFRPLALTKSFALVAAALFAITVVPALTTVFVRGRLRREEESWLVRSALDVYRPVVTYLLDRPAALACVIGTTFILGFAPLGSDVLNKIVLGIALVCTGLLTATWRGRVAAWGMLLGAALVMHSVRPLVWERIPPLDEGTAMDMPITIPRITTAQAGDDLKMRDMVLCRFPEVDMVMGKAGRAETATDPAPIDMIETMVMFRPHEFWPRRKLSSADAQRQATRIRNELLAQEVIDSQSLTFERLQPVVDAVLPKFDAQLREYCYQRNKVHIHETAYALRVHLANRLVARLDQMGKLLRAATPADIAKLAEASHQHAAGTHSPTWRDLRRNIREAVRQAEQLQLISPDQEVLNQSPSWIAGFTNLGLAAVGEPPQTLLTSLTADVRAEHDQLWRRHLLQLNDELVDRAAGVYTRLVLEEMLDRCPAMKDDVREHWEDVKRSRLAKPAATAGGHHHGGAVSPEVRRSPTLDAIQLKLSNSFAVGLLLRPNDRRELGGFGGELDQALQMPGWTNVWTRPIQNRVDMLSTGVNTDIGICVLGDNLDDVVTASQQIADTVNRLSGASQVVADPVRGKPYLKINLDKSELAGRGIAKSDCDATIDLALRGRVVGEQPFEDAPRNVRLVLLSPSQRDPAHLRRLPVVSSGQSAAEHVTLADVADIRYHDGPTNIKSENGKLRNYVRLNIRGRDPQQFIAEAKQTIAEQLSLPSSISLKWTGQFEHQQQSQQRLALLIPVVLLLILGLLIWTYHDVADAVLVLLALPGALAGGLFMQWLLGTSLSVTVLVGYIACFGMASSTGVIMLVYLREAVAKAGGIEAISLPELRAAVLSGAVQRLRPKLLTEATTIIGLAPMLWATGIGSEVIRPMAAPVLGGILVADEVIDLFLPVAFYWVRRWRWQRLQRELQSDPTAEIEATVSQA
jgi:Cu(I)/Ag(I) efflux system membrane protein CusA/SilA